MSSVGVTRRDSLPYSILNGAGVLDAKAEGEAAVKSLATEYGFDWTVARPGQLFGGPYTSAYYLVSTMRIFLAMSSVLCKIVNHGLLCDAIGNVVSVGER